MRQGLLPWVAMVLTLLVGACGPRPPDISLSPVEIDLGPVPTGEIRSMEVNVRNDGESPLRVEGITTSCACTTASIERELLPAGASTRLTVWFDSGAHGEDLVGLLRRQVFIATNDPDEGEVVFAFTVEVVSNEQ